MRYRCLAVLTIVGFTLGSSAHAQTEWTEYRNVADGFKALFPGDPSITHTTWTSATGYALPARLYSVTRGAERYAVTVVDYAGIEAMGLARAKACPPGSETCLGTPGLSGVGLWKHDIRSGPLYAASIFLKQNVTLTEMYWNQQDLVSGIVLQLTNRADESRTYAYIAMHEMRLYIAESTVPRGSPEPALFVQALGWLDNEGNGIRYRTVYSHEIHGLKEAPVPPY